MSKNSLWTIIILLVLGIFGWFVWSSNQVKMAPDEGEALTPGEEVSPTKMVTTKAGAVVPTVAPKTIMLEQTGVSGQSGSAVFQGDGANTKVTLTMIGKKFNAPQPAHIHVGKCPNPGTVKYPLNNVVDGKSETTVSVDIKDLFADLPLAVNVHESVEKASVYTACGDLK